MGHRLREALPGRANRVAHLIDRYLGIGLVFALGASRRRRPVPKEPKRIGLLNTAALGDTILMSGPVGDLRARYPKARIIIISGPSNYDVARLLNVDRVVKLPVFEPIASLRLLRAERLDLLLDFGPWCRLNALLSILSGSRCAIGFRTEGQGRHFGYDLVVQHSSDVHELENHRRIVRVLGIETTHLPTLCGISPGIERSNHLQEPYIVCHLWPGGSSARQKEWPMARWIALAERFAQSRYHVLFTGSANQRPLNAEVIAQIQGSLRHMVHNAAGSPLNESAHLLRGARLVVSVDTGLVHMAAALDVPLVGLYGPSSPDRWGPVSEKALVVGSPLTMSGYLNLGFEKLRNPPPCMEAICYESVERACCVALERAQGGRRSSLRAFPIWTGAVRDWREVTPVPQPSRVQGPGGDP